MSDPLRKLSEKQRECLRLVHSGRTSKEIASAIGVSSHTVDQRLRTAIHALGVGNRRAAAALLAERERADLYQALIYQAPHIAASYSLASACDAAGRVDPPDRNDRRGGWGIAPREPWPEWQGLHLGTGNTLGTLQRVGWIVGIASAATLGFGGLLIGMRGVALLF